MTITDEDKATASEVFLLPRDGDGDYGYQKTDDEIEFDKFKDEFKQSNEYAKVSVYRQPTTSDGRPGQKQLTFLFEAGVDEYNFSQLASRIRDEYGTGVYRVQLRDAENKMRMNRAISIEAPKIKDGESTAQSIPHIIAEMRQTQEANQRQMAQFMRGPNAAVDPVDQMVKMATAMGTMMAALMPAQQPQQTLASQLKEIVMLQEFIGNMRGDNSGGSGEANFFSLMTETVKNFGPMLLAGLAAGQKDGTVNQDGIITGPAKQIENQPQEIEMTTEEKLIAAHKNTVDFLVFQAKGKADPKAVAEFSIDKVPDDDLAPLELFLKRDDCLALLVRANPDVEKFIDWFTAWRDAMISELDSILTDPDEPAQDGNVAGADAETDPETDAGTDASDAPSNT